MQMNILLTSVGRRGYLVRYFKDALGDNGLVMAANSMLRTTGMLAADKCFVVPKVDDQDYIEKLLEICINYNVQLVVSLFDIDLPYLARARSEFLQIGVQVAVSDPWVIEVANDKWKTFSFLESNGFKTPKTYLTIDGVVSALSKGIECFPLLIKPRWGMGSLSIFTAENMEELKFFCGFCRKQISRSYLNILSSVDFSNSVIIQQSVRGTEYGLDVFNNLQGEHFTTVVKEKLDMRSGETDAAITVENETLNSLGLKLSYCLKHRGNLDVDVIVAEDNEPYILELNCRFGGGYPFSHLAGVNFPKALIEMANNKQPKRDVVQIGVIGLKNIVPLRFS
jgi:carbamoyl-phosphate synthase large subunit